MPSSKHTPARTSGTSSAASRRRQWASATWSSLNAITSLAVRDPAPFVTPSRSRTVANVDSIGFVVRSAVVGGVDLDAVVEMHRAPAELVVAKWLDGQRPQ